MPQQNVEKMSKEADEMHRKFYPEQYGEDPLPEDPVPEPPPAESVTPPVTSVEPAVTPPVESITPAPEHSEEGTPAVTETTPAVTAPVEKPPDKPTPEPWEGRYKTLQGKYDAEVPRLFTEIASLKNQLAQAARIQVQTPPSPPPSAGPLNIKTILAGDKALEEQLATFSEDYPDVSELLVKLTERAAAVTTQRVNEAVNAQVQTVQEFQAETRSQHYWDVVNKEIPDWQVTRDDPAFASWLNEIDPYAGVSRADLTQDAIQKFDAHRVINIYKGFRAAKENENQPTTSPVAPSSNIPPVNPAAALVAPPSGSRSAPVSTPVKETPITSAYIKQFYNDAAKGKYRTKDKEFQIIEARINQAVATGKVV
jgi:hypothetical protein